MSAIWFGAAGHGRSAHRQDHFISCDTAPPNHAAHRRGFMVLLMVVAVLAVVALIGGTAKGLTDMGAAFPSLSALFEAASWDKFFAGFGRVMALVSMVGVALLLLRRNRRKARNAAPPEK
jgi:hypothetical protein